jgi:hypothetical protein
MFPARKKTRAMAAHTAAPSPLQAAPRQAWRVSGQCRSAQSTLLGDVGAARSAADDSPSGLGETTGASAAAATTDQGRLSV